MRSTAGFVSAKEVRHLLRSSQGGHKRVGCRRNWRENPPHHWWDDHRDTYPGMTHRCRRVRFRQADIPVGPARENARSRGAKRYSGSGDELLAGSAQVAYFPVPRAWVLRVGEAVGVAAGFDDVAVSRSAIAAQSRGSVKVFVQPENDSLEAIATEFFSSLSVSTWKRSDDIGVKAG